MSTSQNDKNAHEEAGSAKIKNEIREGGELGAKILGRGYESHDNGKALPKNFTHCLTAV